CSCCCPEAAPSVRGAREPAPGSWIVPRPVGGFSTVVSMAASGPGWKVPTGCSSPCSGTSELSFDTPAFGVASPLGPHPATRRRKDIAAADDRMFLFMASQPQVVFWSGMLVYGRPRGDA